jgi:hypothetical protein
VLAFAAGPNISPAHHRTPSPRAKRIPVLPDAPSGADRPGQRTAGRVVVKFDGASLEKIGSAMSQQFPYGQLFPSQRDLRYLLTGELGSNQMCIFEDHLTKLDECRPQVPRLVWERDERHCHSGKTRHGRTVLSVVRYNHGWRVFRYFFEECRTGIPYDLCYALNDHAVLFPSSETAIDAAEVFSFGQYWNVAPLAWMNNEGQYRFGEPTLLLSPDFSYKKCQKRARKKRPSKGASKRPSLH